jgi:hypothetical protein
MNVLILRSQRRPSGEKPTDPYTQVFDGRYAEKVVGNIEGERGFCSACGPGCLGCRGGYDRRLGDRIAGVIELPWSLPHLLERPGLLVPDDVPRHDVLLAIRVHEQVLIEFIRRCGQWGTRGVVVPIESNDWLRGAARAEAREFCEAAGVEVDFPKPFCDFDPPAGSLLAQFRRELHIGRPDVRLTVRDGVIEKARVEVSAACGATYYVARGLEGRRVDGDLKYEVIAKRLHGYPCTASMAWDDELDDTVMHVAGKAHYDLLAPLMGEAPPVEPGMVRSPVGKMVFAPVPARENRENIERAKEAILERLAAGRAVSLAELRNERHITPAAFSSAIVLLTQQGRIRNEAGKIVKA